MTTRMALTTTQRTKDGLMQAPYLLVSDAEWCDATFELYTAEPKAEEYEFLCPRCKRTHTFCVLKKTNNDKYPQ